MSLIMPIELGPTGRPLKEVIRKNSVRCLACDEEIESRHRHDFRFCKGGHVAVDGGHSYLRRVFDGTQSYEETAKDTSEVEQVEMTNDEIAECHKYSLL